MSIVEDLVVEMLGETNDIVGVLCASVTARKATKVRMYEDVASIIAL